MYLPDAFAERDREVLFAHIEEWGFGLLISDGASGLVVSHIPFLLDRRGEEVFLQGHLARENPQCAELAAEGEALAVFPGPDAYISPSWYARGPAVPTWNYVAVHAYGAISRKDDEAWLSSFLRRLVARHEAVTPSPWRFEDLPREYLREMLLGIVGFEIAVSRIEGKWKLSQNRPAADRPRIIAALSERGDPQSLAIARLMRRREPS